MTFVSTKVDEVELWQEEREHVKQFEWVTAIGEKQPNRRVLKSLMDEGGRVCQMEKNAAAV